MRRKGVAVALFALTATAVVVASVAGRGRIPVSPALARSAGTTLAGLGVLVVGLSLYALRGAVGGVEPVAAALVTRGPYRLVRHPIYLGLAAIFAGLSIAARSDVALALLVLGFLPATAWRARLEERALARRFGGSWSAYAARTGRILPRLRWKRNSWL